MKFTSVVLALSAVVAMVQAAPIAPVVDGLSGNLSKRGVNGDVGGEVGGNRIIIPVQAPVDVSLLPETTLRKRDVAGSLDADVDVDVDANTQGLVEINRSAQVHVNRRDLAQSVPTDISTIQNAIDGLVAPIQVTLATLVQVAVDTHIQLALGVTGIVEANADIQGTVMS
jgi:hypothetical protein